MFPCCGCGRSLFEFEVEFHYGDETVDMWHEEPEVAIEDQFNLFTLRATCHDCGKKQEPRVLDL